MTQREAVTIDRRFRGPPRSGNGGYVCGLVAGRLAGVVSVRLMMPPPLGIGLVRESSAEGARLLAGEGDGAEVIGAARIAPLELEVPACPPFDEAESASQSYLGFVTHPFPGCFVCGPEREAGDGLRIFPGAVEGSTTVAAPWVPHASLADASGRVEPIFLWSALDCSGGFAVVPRLDGKAIVLGELCASIEGTATAGEACVVIGWPLGSQGRKHLAGSAIFGADGRLIAKAKAVWVEISPEAFSAVPPA